MVWRKANYVKQNQIGAVEQADERKLLGNCWCVSLKLFDQHHHSVYCHIMYFASPGELTNVAAGFGFTGFKDDGSENWDMIDNANIWGVEVCDAIQLVFTFNLLISLTYQLVCTWQSILTRLTFPVGVCRYILLWTHWLASLRISITLAGMTGLALPDS